jgi:membrane-bound lytic murein transglycosylase B
LPTIRTIALALVAFSLSAAHAVAPDWAYVERRLNKAGLDKTFIAFVRDTYEPAGFEGMIELNCLLFLRKTDYHGPQVSDEAISQVKTFITQNKKAFDGAQKKYGVPPSVIAGLMWIESRYGENQGRFHVTSAFANIVQADRPSMIRHLQATGEPRFTKHLTAKNRREIAAKARTKAKWAIGELKSMQTMYERDKKLVRTLHGSFAGAFGMPQFLPSSYVHYARAAGKGTPDLSKAADAIHSVAFYLKDNGWRQSQPSSFEKALLKYNHSTDYAHAILKLASRADGDSGRIPASRARKHSKK